MQETAHIIIVEQDPFFLDWLTTIFSELDLAVEGFCQLEAAAARIRQEPPDLLLLDYELAGYASPSIIEDFREQYPRTLLPTLYLVECTSISPALRNLSYSDSFWVKGNNVPELIERALALLKLHDVLGVIGHFGPYASSYQEHAPVRMEISCLFADVRGFTAFSENHDPETVAQLLNYIFDIMGRQVITWGGTIDKYIGDSLMAVFGTNPEATTNHAICALAAADAMIKNVDLALKTSLVKNTLNIGIGLSSGMAVVGPIGANIRRDMTAIGSTINLASRLCAKAAPGEILMAANMYQKASSMAQIKERRALTLKGLGEQTAYSVEMGLNNLTI